MGRSATEREPEGEEIGDRWGSGGERLCEGGRERVNVGLLSLPRLQRPAAARAWRPALHVTSPMRTIVRSKVHRARLLRLCSLSLPAATMSSLRHHRVIIASLFLPNTTVIGESAPATPAHESAPTPAFATPATPARQPLLPRQSGPLRSIVEDLRDKVSCCSRSYGMPYYVRD